VLICAYPAALDPFFIDSFISINSCSNDGGHPGSLSVVNRYNFGGDISVRKFV
jgi:hypothetical protein